MPQRRQFFLQAALQAKLPGQADKRARPRARRALMIWRPDLVLILARNPWVRLRLIMLG